MLCGIKVTNVTKEKHQGHMFSSEYCKSFNLINIDDVIRDMKVRTNTIVTQFSISIALLCVLPWNDKVKFESTKTCKMVLHTRLYDDGR